MTSSGVSVRGLCLALAVLLTAIGVSASRAGAQTAPPPGKPPASGQTPPARANPSPFV